MHVTIRMLACITAVARAFTFRQYRSLVLDGSLASPPDIYGDDVGAVNCEHIVPVSYFGGLDRAAGADPHNLFRCDAGINRARSNFRFVDDAGPHARALGDGGARMCAPRRCFEPADDYRRGIIARAVAHMYDSYPREIIVPRHELLEDRLLWAWHFGYPPTEDEVARNRLVVLHGGPCNRFVPP